MKRYKHKSTGDIAELKIQAGYSLNKNTIGLIPVEYIENSNDWEEVKEPLYVTHDGYEVKDFTTVLEWVQYLEDEDKYVLASPLAIHKWHLTGSLREGQTDWVVFKSKDKALEFIKLENDKIDKKKEEKLLDSECLSYNDIKHLIKDWWTQEKMKELVKSKQ